MVPRSSIRILGTGRSYGGARRNGAALEVTAELRGVAELNHLGNVAVQVLAEAGPTVAVGRDATGRGPSRGLACMARRAGKS